MIIYLLLSDEKNKNQTFPKYKLVFKDFFKIVLNIVF